MKLHRIKAGHYTAKIDGGLYSIIHSLHWDIYYGGESGNYIGSAQNLYWDIYYGGEPSNYICSAHTLTDARKMLEEIIEGGLPI